jgi:CRP-like cAMP-binding protein
LIWIKATAAYVGYLTSALAGILAELAARCDSHDWPRRSCPTERDEKELQMSSHLDNHLLARLDHIEFARIEPLLALVELRQGDVIAETHAQIERVYFPHGGIISCVVELMDGRAIETGMIGKDGQYGAGPALDHKVSLNHVVIQVAGNASVMDANQLRNLAQVNPKFREIIIRYEQFFLAQVQQTAACNAVHDVHSRSCKWILRMQRLVGDDLPLTQEFLAQMMGVRRTSVTSVAQELQMLGLISYSRGQIHILDVAKVSQRACECDATINSHYGRIFYG